MCKLCVRSNFKFQVVIGKNKSLDCIFFSSRFIFISYKDGLILQIP